MKRNQTKGFTLIEVTLAIVIGIILIAGATLIYNQAKNSAGNSRAQAKVASLQSLIEQYMARADGVAPNVTVVRALWGRARPDDFNKSPWGGMAQPVDDTVDNPLNPAADSGRTNGVYEGADYDADRANLLSTQILQENTGNFRNDPNSSGILVYYDYSGTNNPAGDFAIWDEGRRSQVKHKTYGVAAINQKGDRWFFVRGNQAGNDERNMTDLSGKIGD